MSSQKAHWYNIIAPSKSDPLSNDINQIFPPISLLFNIEVPIMNRVLEISSLCHRRGEVLFPVVQACHDFIMEYGINVELTMFSMENKRRYFLELVHITGQAILQRCQFSIGEKGVMFLPNCISTSWLPYLHSILVGCSQFFKKRTMITWLST